MERISTESIIQDLRLQLRVADSMFDDEVRMLADSAVDDMIRVGVKPGYIRQMPPLVRHAIGCYVKAGFGFDNPDAQKLRECYRQLVIDMLNSDANVRCSDD